MKATVNSYLNARVGSPSVNAPCYSFVKPGDQVEYSDTVNGDSYEGNTLWLQGKDDIYYWSGGVELVSAPSEPAWWITEFGISEIWNDTRGSGITVAVLDSGLSGHDSLKKNNIDGYDFVLNNDNYSDHIDGHGTHITGIIAGAGEKIFGLAPDVKIFMAKVLKANGDLDYQAFIAALQKCVELNIDVINCSFTITPKHFEESPFLQEKLPPLIENIGKRGMFLTAACGNYAMQLDCYPAMLRGCISVTAIDQYLEIFRDACSSNTIAIAAPGVDILSAGLNNTTLNLSGTSQATAYISGFLALAKSRMISQNTFSYSRLLKELLNPQNLTNNTLPQDQFGKGIVNPTKIFDSIK
jgi:subtilisin family serine protease